MSYFYTFVGFYKRIQNETLYNYNIKYLQKQSGKTATRSIRLPKLNGFSARVGFHIFTGESSNKLLKKHVFSAIL